MGTLSSGRTVGDALGTVFMGPYEGVVRLVKNRTSTQIHFRATSFLRNEIQHTMRANRYRFCASPPYLLLAALYKLPANFMWDLYEIGVLEEKRIGREMLFVHPKFLKFLAHEPNDFSPFAAGASHKLARSKKPLPRISHEETQSFEVRRAPAGVAGTGVVCA